MTQQHVLSVTKNTEAKLPVWMLWSPWLTGEQEQLGGGPLTITSSTWLVEAATGDTTLAVAVSPAPSINGGTTQCWVEGGTRGVVYRLVNRINTSAGHTAVERHMLVLVDD
jgi:hypothetical protein